MIAVGMRDIGMASAGVSHRPPPASGRSPCQGTGAASTNGKVMMAWEIESKKDKVDAFLTVLLGMRHTLAGLSTRPAKFTITIDDQQLFIDVVFALLSELDFHTAQDMGLPHAYKRWQFSFHEITVRANRNASNWTYPNRIVLPDGSVVDPKS